MRKKILVKESGLMDFFKSFFQAKVDGRESQWLQRLRKADPDLADVWSDFDDKVSKSMYQQKRDLQKARTILFLSVLFTLEKIFSDYCQRSKHLKNAQEVK